jgi:predicted RNase H-like HicB family nuclease
MPPVNDTIHVNVAYFTGQDEGDVGYPYYVASCVEITAVTDARSLDELMQNIQEMVALHLEDLDTVALFNLVPNPRIVVTVELPASYAETA